MSLYSKARRPNDDDSTPPKLKGKQFVRLIVLIFLALLPVFSMVVQNALSLEEATALKSEGQETGNEIVFSTEIGHIVHDLALERGTSSLFISSGGDTDIYQRLLRIYEETDDSIGSLSHWLPYDKHYPDNFKSPEELKTHLAHHRSNVWFKQNETSVEKEIQFYTDINKMLIHIMSAVLSRADTSQLWTTIVAYQMLLGSIESANIEMNLGWTFFNKGPEGFSTDELIWYDEALAIGVSQLENAIVYNHAVEDDLEKEFYGTPHEKELTRLRNQIKKNKVSNAPAENGAKWLEVMDTYTHVLEEIDEKLSEEVLKIIDGILQQNNVRLSSGFSILIVVACIGPVIVLGVFKMASESQAVAANLEKVTTKLAVEQKKSDKLLYSVFPSIIVESMKKAEKVPAEYFDQATIMFSDVVGFTEATASLSPHKVIDLLNRMDHAFEAVFTRYDVYKMETMAGSYMVASGLPIKNGDQHAEQISCAALHLLKAGRAFHPMHIPYPMEFRIGIHTGPCVAGVVGSKRPRYYIFGNTVNIAQSLEKTAQPSKIHISSSTSELLVSLGGVFNLEPRGEVTIKDGVKMTTYWLSQKE
ncbi:NPR2 [Branchiostoma lanceolatum]|uniref:NPR2 protein n=1 Tax=Branchiostoma lanceolatum TaxID=7740 RepID=A0A8J9ZB91_BRALA|nr:NPR2 [Branchiostoma lanceolatum]